MNGSEGLMSLSLTICLLAGFLNAFQSGEDNFAKTRVKPKAPRFSSKAYTPEEKRLICSELAILGNPSSMETWEKIAQTHKMELDAGSTGFNRERSPDALRKHFFDVVIHKNIELVPDCVKDMLKDRKNMDYTQEEEDFIIAALLAYDGRILFSDEMWKSIKLQHDLRVDANVKGFAARKSYSAIRWHFYHQMSRNNRVPLPVLQKFQRISRTEQGSSSGTSSNPKRKSDSLLNEEEIRESEMAFIDFFEKELQNASDLCASNNENFDDVDDDNDDEFTKLKL